VKSCINDEKRSYVIDNITDTHNSNTPHSSANNSFHKHNTNNKQHVLFINLLHS